MASQQQGLHVDQMANGDPLTEKRMQQFLELALLIGGDHLFPRAVIHYRAANGCLDEAIGEYLSPIDEGQDQSIGEESSKLFHEV